MQAASDAPAPVRRRPHAGWVRGTVRRLVQDDPGIHYMEVVRRSGLGNGTVQHHLQALVHDRELVAVRTAGHTCYFLADASDPAMVRLRTAVRAPTTRTLLGLLATQPRSLTTLAAAAGMPVSTVHYHVRKLANVGAVAPERLDGRRVLALTPLGRAFVREARADAT